MGPWMWKPAHILHNTKIEAAAEEGMEVEVDQVVGEVEEAHIRIWNFLYGKKGNSAEAGKESQQQQLQIQIIAIHNKDNNYLMQS